MLLLVSAEISGEDHFFLNTAPPPRFGVLSTGLMYCDVSTRTYIASFQEILVPLP